jgi:hypothetical protein
VSLYLLLVCVEKGEREGGWSSLLGEKEKLVSCFKLQLEFGLFHVDFPPLGRPRGSHIAQGTRLDYKLLNPSEL